MFLFLISLLVAVVVHAGGDSINPERLITPLLDIFSIKNRQLPGDNFEVRVSEYDKYGDIRRGKKTHIMTKRNYEKAKLQSSAVFEMIPEEGHQSNGSEDVHLGTAFHIGENLVLTNHHVLSPDRSNLNQCDRFALHTSDRKWKFSCKKVHHCDEELDVCLVEMRPARQCLNFFCTKEENYQLKDGPSLKLKKEPSLEHEQIDKVVMTAIGNTMGMGIHYSQGKGLRFLGNRLFFYAPLRTGNSGGPLIGEDGLVWGVVKQESKDTVSENAFNVAASTSEVIKIMKKNLSNDEVTLNKFNHAIQE
jgi:hypothetical protein